MFESTVIRRDGIVIVGRCYWHVARPGMTDECSWATMISGMRFSGSKMMARFGVWIPRFIDGSPINRNV
jgi:hypothetical protein